MEMAECGRSGIAARFKSSQVKFFHFVNNFPDSLRIKNRYQYCLQVQHGAFTQLHTTETLSLPINV